MSTGAQVLIVGAGPTGLLLANLLGARGITVTILERKEPPDRSVPETEQSRAIGVTPPSLEILSQVGLAEALVHCGVSIQRAVVHGRSVIGERAPLGELRFEGIHHRFPFILSGPQTRTQAILEEGLHRFPSVRVEYGREVIRYAEADGEISEAATVQCTDGTLWSGQYCVVADGAHGTTALAAGIGRRGAPYRPWFTMGDYRDGSGLGAEAHLWFTVEGAVESFPLPEGRRRWIVQQERDVEQTVLRRTGYTLNRADRIRESWFQPSWSEADTFHRNRIFLAGDAAHTMSPIGGQGMNTGFGDAEQLAITLETLLNPEATSAPGTQGARPATAATPELYTRTRRRASRAATRRAAAGMFVGTIRGGVASRVRNGAVRLILRGPLRVLVARHFAMLTRPVLPPG